MAEHEIASVDDFNNNPKQLLTINGIDVGVFRVDGEFYAWRNVCPHQGGPVCQGRIFKRVVDDIDAEMQVHGRRYNDAQVHIVCPWHGAEFNIRTGAHAGIPELKLTPIDVFARDGKVYLRDD
ncbi:MAG: Rieske 2Fe-2S domain-containing protein [Pseudomonadota bacterium]